MASSFINHRRALFRLSDHRHVMRAARVPGVVIHYPRVLTSLLSQRNLHKCSQSLRNTLNLHQVISQPCCHTFSKANFSSTSRKMVKDTETVIQEFNELVNMTAKDLKDWLGSEESTGSGWVKDDGSGETIGHESGRKIIKILEKNPKKDPEQYDEEDIDHMRKVVAYCKRHLAQEAKAKQDTESKSYRSLKNWGHDAQKA